jgi:hypothetical protein
VTNDRPSDQLWEKADIGAIFDESIDRCLAAGTIDKIGNLLESEKTDPEGKNNTPLLMRDADKI